MPSAIRKHPDFTACLLLAAIVLGLTLPFIGHAFHIDEPLFLRIAQQIKEHPLDPYGFWYLWNLKYEPIYQIAAFPPVFSYFLALVGWFYLYPPEWLIHASTIPFAVLAAWSFYYLCRQWNFAPKQSLLAACLLAVSPAFAISANLAMPDVAALALSLLAFALAVRGWKNDRIRFLLASGVSLGLAMLMRYNSVPLVPVLFLLGWTFSSVKKAVIPPLVATLIFCGWMIVSTFVAGTSHTSEVVSVFADLKGWGSRLWSMNIHLTLTTFLPPLVVLLWWRRSLWFALLLAFVAVDFALFSGRVIKQFALTPDVLFFLLGLAALLVLGIDFFKHWKAARLVEVKWQDGPSELGVQLQAQKPDALIGNDHFRSMVLYLWILAVLSIPIIYVHFASKYLLLAQPPLILLILPRLARSPKLQKACFLLVPLIGGLSFLMANSDFSMANAYRSQAQSIAKQYVASTFDEEKSPLPMVWFTGHWGWQYYMENFGAVALPYEYEAGKGPLPGDLIVTPKFASANIFHPNLEKNVERTEVQTFQLDLPLRMMNPLARSGFYSNHWGPLPYNLSSTPIEEFNFYRLKPQTIPGL